MRNKDILFRTTHTIILLWGSKCFKHVFFIPICNFSSEAEKWPNFNTRILVIILVMSGQYGFSCLLIAYFFGFDFTGTCTKRYTSVVTQYTNSDSDSGTGAGTLRWPVQYHDHCYSSNCKQHLRLDQQGCALEAPGCHRQGHPGYHIVHMYHDSKI